MNRKRRDSFFSEPHSSKLPGTLLTFISGMGMGAAIMYVLLESTRPTTVLSAKHNIAEAGRRDDVGHTGVYPATGPFPPGEAEVVSAGQLGGGSYEQHGTSTFTTNTGTPAVIVDPVPAEAAQGQLSLLEEGEIPRERWLIFFNQLDKEIRDERVTVELRENGETRVAQRDMPIDGFGADVRARELIINVGVGSTKDDLVIHTISAERVRVRKEGDSRVLEIEARDGRVILVRFRSGNFRRQQVA